jgi:hypothetical protein
VRDQDRARRLRQRNEPAPRQIGPFRTGGCQPLDKTPLNHVHSSSHTAGAAGHIGSIAGNGALSPKANLKALRVSCSKRVR